MPTNSANLRNRIVIQKKVRTPDGAGGFTDDGWSDVMTLHAAIKDVKGVEKFEQGQVKSNTYTRFTCRYRAGITKDMRIVERDGTTYNIRSTPRSDRENFWMTIDAEAIAQ